MSAPPSRDPPTESLFGDGMLAIARVMTDEMLRRGQDPTKLLAARRLPQRTTWRPLARAPRAQIILYIEDCVRVTGDPAFHLHAMRNAEIGAFEVADFLVIMAPTLGQGLRAVGSQFDLVNSGCTFLFDEGPDEIRSSFVAYREARPHPLETLSTFVGADSRARSGSRGQHHASRVELTQSSEGCDEQLTEVMGCPIVFGCPVDVIVFTREAWDFPPHFRNSMVEALMKRALPTAGDGGESGDLRDAVRRALAIGFTRGQLRAREIAHQLGASERSLQRRLAELGTSFAELLTTERYRRALRLLVDPKARAGAVGLLLGFSEPSAFTRAFRRWTGMSPRQYQERDPDLPPLPPAPKDE